MNPIVTLSMFISMFYLNVMTTNSFKVTLGLKTSNTLSQKNDSLWYKDFLCHCNISQLKKKILFKLHTSPLGGHSGFLKTYHRVKKEFFGTTLNLIFRSLWQNVWFANKIKLRERRPGVYYNLYPFEFNVRRMSQQILSQDYPSMKERVSSWCQLINLPSMHTFVHCLILLKLIQLLLHLRKQFKSYMETQRLL